MSTFPRKNVARRADLPSPAALSVRVPTAAKCNLELHDQMLSSACRRLGFSGLLKHLPRTEGNLCPCLTPIPSRSVPLNGTDTIRYFQPTFQFENLMSENSDSQYSLAHSYELPPDFWQTRDD